MRGSDWSWRECACRRETDGTARELRGHEDMGFPVAVSPDARWLVTGSADRTVRLWDLAAADPGATPRVLRGHEGPVTTVVVSPDGCWLVTGSRDRTARLWPMRVEERVALACRTAGRNLSYEEWRTYFGVEPYRVICPALPTPPPAATATPAAAPTAGR